MSCLALGPRSWPAGPAAGPDFSSRFTSFVGFVPSPRGGVHVSLKSGQGAGTLMSSRKNRESWKTGEPKPRWSDILKSFDQTAVAGNPRETENCFPEGGHSCPPCRVRQENQRDSASWNGQLESLVQGHTQAARQPLGRATQGCPAGRDKRERASQHSVAKQSVVAPPKNCWLIRFPERSGCLNFQYRAHGLKLPHRDGAGNRLVFCALRENAE